MTQQGHYWVTASLLILIYFFSCGIPGDHILSQCLMLPLPITNLFLLWICYWIAYRNFFLPLPSSQLKCVKKLFSFQVINMKLPLVSLHCSNKSCSSYAMNTKEIFPKSWKRDSSRWCQLSLKIHDPKTDVVADCRHYFSKLECYSSNYSSKETWIFTLHNPLPGILQFPELDK